MILVTGGAGFIGGNLVLDSLGHAVRHAYAFFAYRIRDWAYEAAIEVLE